MRLFPPGSIAWLLVHEVRVAIRGFTLRKGQRWPWRLPLALTVMGGFAGWGGWMLSGVIAGRHLPEHPMLFLGLELGMAVLFTLMLAQTLTLSAQAFFERNDLDLLLSSPIAPARVLTVRTLGIAVTASLLYLMLASALLIPLALRGDVRWLAIYVVVLDLALLASAAGLGLAMTLMRILGPRRTRMVSQVLAALIGASAFLAGQSRNMMSRDQWRDLTGRFGGDLQRTAYDVHALYSWPARAVLGDPLPLLAVTAVCGAAFWAVTVAAGRRFGADAAAAAGVSLSGAGPTRRRAAAADNLRFAGGPLRTLARKDWRLLVRDPWLLSQMLLQMLWFIPLGFVVARALKGELAAAAAAPIVFLTGQLAGNLAWVVVSAEDSPELIISAPIDGRQVVRAKLLVALTPVAVISAVPLLVLSALQPLAGLAAALCCVGAWASVGLINVWYARPAKRKEMMRRQKTGGGLMGVVEMLVLFAWAGTALLAAFGQPWALIPPVIIAGLLFMLRRPTVYRPALA